MFHPAANLDDAGRLELLQRRVHGKVLLRRIYEETYRRFALGLARCPKSGTALEIGSGPGFLKDFIPEVLSADIIPYDGLDLVLDAARLPFCDSSLRALFLLNVFHHLRDPASFLQEAQRALQPGGRIFLVDQYLGWLSTPVYRWLHHEPFNPKALDWAFQSQGPLTGANGALAWIVFERDKQRLKALVPYLRIERYEPILPLSYWLAGGLQAWTLVPGWAAGAALALDHLLITLAPRLASFVAIEIVKLPG